MHNRVTLNFDLLTSGPMHAERLQVKSSQATFNVEHDKRTFVQ